MFEKYFLKNLKPDEKFIKIVRQYWLTLFWSYFLSLLAIVLVFFLLYPLLKLGEWGLLIFFGSLLVALVYIVRTIFIWSLNSFLITDKRVIDFDQKGLFYKNVTETTFDNIQDISYNKKGIFATLFNYGNVVVKTASGDTDLELKKVHQPSVVQDLLVDCQYKFNKKE